MMSGFLVKLATPILVEFLVVDTSALPNDGGAGRKSLPHDFGCGSSLRKTFPGKEGSFGCENLVNSGKENLPFRVLRSIPGSPPPPIKNQRSSYGLPAPPLQML